MLLRIFLLKCVCFWPFPTSNCKRRNGSVLCYFNGHGIDITKDHSSQSCCQISLKRQEINMNWCSTCCQSQCIGLCDSAAEDPIPESSSFLVAWTSLSFSCFHLHNTRYFRSSCYIHSSPVISLLFPGCRSDLAKQNVRNTTLSNIEMETPTQWQLLRFIQRNHCHLSTI